MRYLLLFSVFFSLEAMATNYVCHFKDKIVDGDLKSEITVTQLQNGKYEMTGDDGTNPFDCCFKSGSQNQDLYTCESYQGSYYAKVYVSKKFETDLKIDFRYVDENTGAVTSREVLNCAVQ